MTARMTATIMKIVLLERGSLVSVDDVDRDVEVEVWDAGEVVVASETTDPDVDVGIMVDVKDVEDESKDSVD